MKKCLNCKNEKEEIEFSKHKRHKDGLSSWCKVCCGEYIKLYRRTHKIQHNKLNRKWAKNNPQKVKESSKNWYKNNPKRILNCFLKRKFGITLEQKLQMIKDQDNKCGICHNEFQNTKDIHVDHNHITNKVRGLLCHKCNCAYGLFGCDETKENLINAIEYYDKSI